MADAHDQVGKQVDAILKQAQEREQHEREENAWQQQRAFEDRIFGRHPLAESDIVGLCKCALRAWHTQPGAPIVRFTYGGLQFSATTRGLTGLLFSIKNQTNEVVYTAFTLDHRFWAHHS